MEEAEDWKETGGTIKEAGANAKPNHEEMPEGCKKKAARRTDEA
jgi:hypothetical protein